jgi:hypothetical protein
MRRHAFVCAILGLAAGLVASPLAQALALPLPGELRTHPVSIEIGHKPGHKVIPGHPKHDPYYSSRRYRDRSKGRRDWFAEREYSRWSGYRCYDWYGRVPCW